MSETNNQMTGEQLRSIRKEMTMKQAGMASALGLTPQFVGMMERGEKPIEPRTAMAVRYLLEHPESRPGDAKDYDEPRVWNAADLIRHYETEGNTVVDGREWGPWRLDTGSMTLDYRSEVVPVDRDENNQPIMGRRERYYVMLAEMLSLSEIARWISHISRKPWGAPAAGYFVEAIDDIFDLAAMAHNGRSFANEEAVVAFLERRTRPSE